MFYYGENQKSGDYTDQDAEDRGPNATRNPKGNNLFDSPAC
jgi:hypothetical protein